METIKVLHNQSLLDIAIQYTGSVENAFPISVANGISVSDDLTKGTALIIPNMLEINTDIVDYYKAKRIYPATAYTDTSLMPMLEGIGYWIIEKNFKVSENGKNII